MICFFIFNSMSRLPDLFKPNKSRTSINGDFVSYFPIVCSASFTISTLWIFFLLYQWTGLPDKKIKHPYFNKKSLQCQAVPNYCVSYVTAPPSQPEHCFTAAKSSSVSAMACILHTSPNQLYIQLYLIISSCNRNMSFKLTDSARTQHIMNFHARKDTY